MVLKNLKGGNIDEEEEYLQTIEEKIFNNVRNTLINQGCVFFGSYANRMYLKNLKKLKKENSVSS